MAFARPLPHQTRETILDRWAEGLTASQIARELRLKSRNTVLGHVDRARKRGDTRALMKAPARRGWRFVEPPKPEPNEFDIRSVPRLIASGRVISLPYVSCIDGGEA